MAPRFITSLTGPGVPTIRQPLAAVLPPVINDKVIVDSPAYRPGILQCAVSQAGRNDA
jgi:hypothetical protein